MTMDDTDRDERVSDIVRASTRGRLLLALAALIALGLLAAFHYFALPFLSSTFGPAPPHHAVTTIRYALIGITAGVAFAGMLVIWYGKKISRQGQFPLPGASVWRDTPVKRGRAAVRIAWLHYAAGAFLSILCIVLSAYIWMTIDRLAPQFKLPPGVTILQHRPPSVGK